MRTLAQRWVEMGARAIMDLYDEPADWPISYADERVTVAILKRVLGDIETQLLDALAHYPEAVFPPIDNPEDAQSASSDRIGGNAMRHAYRRALAIVRGEEPKSTTRP